MGCALQKHLTRLDDFNLLQSLSLGNARNQFSYEGRNYTETIWPAVFEADEAQDPLTSKRQLLTFPDSLKGVRSVSHVGRIVMCARC